MSERLEKLLVAIGLFAILHGAFTLVGRWVLAHPTPPPAWLHTPLDTLLPLVPGFVWLYASWYIAAAIPLALDRARFREAYQSYALAFALCIASYFVLPVTITRPSLVGLDGSAANAVRTLYAIDPPVNLFPSFHAAVAVILALLVPRTTASRVVGWAWAVAIMLACVLTKQHYILDVLAGAGVGVAATASVAARAQRRTAAPAVEGLSLRRIA